MFWTLAILLLLVVTGGFISYYGDLQGRRWGKRRVSWFGMRPKHTAILITSITGSVIALLTVGAVMLAAPNVANVILHGEAAINENQRLRKQSKMEVDALHEELKGSKTQLATTRADEIETKKMAAAAKLEMEKLKQLKEGLDKRNATLITGNMDLQRESAALVRGIQTNQKLIAQQKKEIANQSKINFQLGRQNSDYARENSALARDNARLAGANSKLKASNAQLTLTKENLQRNYDTVNNTYQGALEDYKQLQDQMKQLQDQTTGAKSEQSRLKSQLEDLKQRRDDLYSELVDRGKAFARSYMELRQTRYSLRADTELARRTLDSHLSPKSAREELMTLLNAASDRARQFGAMAGGNGRTVAIVPKRVVTPASVQVADESASINAIVDTVAGSNTPVVVVVRAINNSVANEQVLIELTSFTSTTVFKQGENVAKRTIDARQPIDGLVGSVVQFLREDVRSAAIKAGTIPQISPENGEEEVGMIDTPEMITLVDRIRRMGGSVELTAVANETLTSADLLTFGQSRGGKAHNLRFDLKRVSDKSRAKSMAAAK